MNATVAPLRSAKRTRRNRLTARGLILVAGGVLFLGIGGLRAEPSPATPGAVRPPADTLKQAQPASGGEEKGAPSGNMSGNANGAAANRQGPGRPPGTDLVDSLSPGELQKAIDTLKANYFRPGEIADGQLQRAMLAGILARIAPGAALVETGRPPAEANSPFKSQVLNETIGYIRLGTISPGTLAELDSVLKNGASLGSLILDLRATPPSNDFQTAAEILREFCPSGKQLFSIKKELPGGAASPNQQANAQKFLASDQARPFEGPLMVLIGRENAGAAEIVAAALRQNAKAILIGETTRGEGVEFAEFKLGTEKAIRIAVAEVALPDGSVIYPKGLKPDIRVEAPKEAGKILAQELEQGVLPFVTETERPRMNEASLVAGTNPEIDAMENAQKAAAEKNSPPPLRDTALQRALDLIATINIYEKERK